MPERQRSFGWQPGSRTTGTLGNRATRELDNRATGQPGYRAIDQIHRHNN